MKARSWADVVKRGVELSKPVYYAQLQLYMAYMELEVALFTCLNKDTQELHHEKVGFVPHIAQGLSDKAVEIIRAAEANDLPPRIAASSFSLSPPIGSTRPRKVTSPVIATSLRTGTPVRVETIAVVTPMPAEGPSLGTAPSGRWMWMSLRAIRLGLMP